MQVGRQEERQAGRQTCLQRVGRQARMHPKDRKGCIQGDRLQLVKRLIFLSQEKM
jgi:hypothetical protein